MGGGLGPVERCRGAVGPSDVVKDVLKLDVGDDLWGDADLESVVAFLRA